VIGPEIGKFILVRTSKSEILDPGQGGEAEHWVDAAGDAPQEGQGAPEWQHGDGSGIGRRRRNASRKRVWRFWQRLRSSVTSKLLDDEHDDSSRR
jgi:hypothetical protein